LSWYDIVNGSFEVLGAIATWSNVRRLRRDKHVSGVNWYSMAFFAAWGLWNLVYYPHLNQWASFVGGILLVMGNLVWTALAIYYKRKGS
jgi:predicted membrane channel-forming protein YqfA (hemolysin III family)